MMILPNLRTAIHPNILHANTAPIPCNSKKLPLPPFGQELALLRAWNVTPPNSVYLFAGVDCWSQSKVFKDTKIILCLPYSKDPASYSWPVKDCDVLIIDTGFLSISDIERLAYILLCSGASIVRAILFNNKTVVYRGGTI